MVDQYDVDGYDADMLPSTYGDWVKYEDYSKLADLCGRMKFLLIYTTERSRTQVGSVTSKLIKKAITEAEEVLK